MGFEARAETGTPPGSPLQRSSSLPSPVLVTREHLGSAEHVCGDCLLSPPACELQGAQNQPGSALWSQGPARAQPTGPGSAQLVWPSSLTLPGGCLWSDPVIHSLSPGTALKSWGWGGGAVAAAASCWVKGCVEGRLPFPVRGVAPPHSYPKPGEHRLEEWNTSGSRQGV